MWNLKLHCLRYLLPPKCRWPKMSLLFTFFNINFECLISYKNGTCSSHLTGFRSQYSLRICGNKMPTRCNKLFLLQILLLAQHVSGTTMPIIRSSRVLYRWLLRVVFGALVFKLSVWCGAEGCVSGLWAAASGARNMLSKQ